MRKLFLLLFPLFICCVVMAQKKPLDHTVYDGWQSIGERMISNDGRWVVYSVNPQEGDNELVIQSADATYKKTIARGYNAVITEDSRYAIFRIKPLFKDTRDARIKKKRPDEMPKDSFAIVELGKDEIWKLARVKSYKTPTKESGWVAYHLEKPIEKKETPGDRPRRPEGGNNERRANDSLKKVIDSLQHVIETMPVKKKKKNKDDGDTDIMEEGDEDASEYFADDDPAPADAGTDLIVRNLSTGQEKTFNNVIEYYFSQKGGKLLFEQAKNPKDSLSKASVVLYDLKNDNSKVIIKGGNDFKNFSFSEDGDQLAFVAERDAKPKELQKFYKLWYYRTGMDSASMIVDRYTTGMQLGSTISEYGNIDFSKSGKRLFFGTAPVTAPKDTTLIDIDLVKLDIWHYNDDYLQTQQLFRLNRDLQTNYLAVYLVDDKMMRQLGTKELPTIYQSKEGDGEQFVGVTDFGKRVESQWTGNTKKDIYAIDVATGAKKLVKKDMEGNLSPQYISPNGKYIMWYESKAKNYFVWDGATIKNATAKIKVPLYDEEHDSPSDPPAYGIMAWHEGDSAVYVYDRYDIWKVNMDAGNTVKNFTQQAGRNDKHEYRYVRTDLEERFIKHGKLAYFRDKNDVTKDNALKSALIDADGIYLPGSLTLSQGKYSYGQLITKAKNINKFIFTKENYQESPDLYIAGLPKIEDGATAIKWVSDEKKLSSINQQQKEYNWGTAELYKWKALNGKESSGVLYKPENFDATKKYPMILYFYETHSNDLHDYMPPTPTGSRLNISFFVSRGYIVFTPDIHYTTGKPAKSCYDYVVSAAQDLGKKSWVDEKNMGIQGQSWGGIQVAQLVTMTDIFKAAWAGAPVANMTSAYGGIRWESGANRQFQYEKTQSRIGATLWEKPELYIENSPLFHLPKVKTPLVIMSNDADGAVPWYQGIELFTAMRRLGKKVWLLNYNGEAHNLVERKNKKDISIREQQYFDWLLKGEHPPKWITEGVPAIKKGKEWGLELSGQAF
ncbi:MAG TPA: prolyl oligopeptidase family serine peptidase [Chitinophagaceae bacterium]|nr:prolyl oligopeptidase family serine peptidase [Chitinophagaceae bacterium]